MPEQSALDLEPRDQDRPMRDGVPSKPPGITFADLPESTFPARFAPPDAEETGTEPAGQAGNAGVTPVSPVAPQPQPQAPSLSPEAVEQAVARGVQFGLQTAEQRAQQANAMRQRQEQVAREWAPPTIPDGQEFDELISDPKRLRQFFVEQGEFARNAALAAATPAVNSVQEVRRAYTQLAERIHQDAWGKARQELVAAGVENPDDYYGHVETAMRGQPQTYWQLRTDPRALVAAVKIVRDNIPAVAMQGASAAMPRPADVGAQPSAPAARGGGENRNHPAIARAEKALGVKFTPESRREFFERTQGA